MDKDISSTPVKTFTRIHLTPSTKECVCIIHGELIENCNYRLKLFQKDTKTSHCLLLEKWLKESICKEDCATHVCKACIRKFVQVEKKLNLLKGQFESTKQNLEVTHGKQAKKRLQSITEPCSKKTLFSGDETVENLKTLTSSSPVTDLCQQMDLTFHISAFKSPEAIFLVSIFCCEIYHLKSNIHIYINIIQQTMLLFISLNRYLFF